MSAAEDPTRDLLDELRRRIGEALEGADEAPLARLEAHARYQLGDVIGHGGMGTVHQARDENLRRIVAMKIARPPAREPGSDPEQSSALEARRVRRFLREARITGQLNHPGVIPVHELGVKDDGQVYFTMPLLRGQSLRQVFALARSGEQDWTITRALGALQRVCETVAYAHACGVIHRDLKPDNIMVGGFGEVYVLDWGLAKVQGEAGWQVERPEEERALEHALEVDPGASVVGDTLEGSVLGTVGYMAPEQAAGRVAATSPAADVYALGAMLYALLAGHAPYQLPDGTRTREELLRATVSGPPASLHGLARGQPVEVIAIVERAMARRAEDRYPSMHALGEDLRAYLEGRVVRAYEVGAWAEARKWVRRNSALAAALALVILSVCGGLFWSSHLKARAREERILTTDSYTLTWLQSEWAELYPAEERMLGAMRAWLAVCAELETRLPQHQQRLARFEAGLERDASGRPLVPLELMAEHRRLRALAGMQDFLQGADGQRAQMEERLAFARALEPRSVSSPRARALWLEAIEAIADPERSPLYGGLRIEPQLGLIPLGPDARSGLWEFAHLPSGEPAIRDAPGEELVREGETGIVLVLIPGGRFLMGAQIEHPDQPNYGGPHSVGADPVHEVELAAYFLSKYEMTQGQWIRALGGNPNHNPSFWGAWYSQEYLERHPEEAVWYSEQDYLLHPVESVTWYDCDRILRQLDLVLPTEAQWERAARAGGELSPWWSGSDAASLEDKENLRDQSVLEYEGFDPRSVTMPWRDGFAQTSPAGLFEPNPYGLHDMLGNVGEWCRDPHSNYSLAAHREGDGYRDYPAKARSVRPGNYEETGVYATLSTRFQRLPNEVASNLGVRPARPLQ